MTQIDPRALRNAFGAFMTGVTVVTALDADDKPLGFTANSFTSVSMDPPLVLVCLANSSANYNALVESTGFAINILAENQIEVSNTFARPVEDRFATVGWRRGPCGSPIIDEVCAWFDCSMHKTVDAGDHVILIGKVEAFESSPIAGLGYARGAYVTPSTAAQALETNTHFTVSALIERNGEVLLVENDDGSLRLPELIVDGQGASATLKKLIHSTGLLARPGFIYSVFDDTSRKQQHISFLCQAAKGEPKQGSFVALDANALEDISDPAVLAMLKRFAKEHDVDNYGIYYGNELYGEVRTTLPGDKI